MQSTRIDPKPANTLVDIFDHIEKHYRNPKAFNDYENEKWVSVSTESFIQQVKYLTLALVRMGVRRGDNVGVLAQPCTKWTVADFAIVFAGGVTVPLFGNISEDNFVFECTQADIKTIFVGGDEQWGMYRRNKGLFQTVIMLDKRENEPGSLSYEEVLKTGESVAAKEPEKFEELKALIQPSDTAAIIYTSGSTGVPKGVELTHKNIASVLYNTRFNWVINEDRYLSILPLAHVFGHLINFYAMNWGICIYYFNDYKRLVEACVQVAPTILVIVPRVTEKIYEKFITKSQELHGIKRYIVRWALKKAAQSHKLNKSSLSFKIADHFVYSKLRNALGGSLRVIMSGGAATSPEMLYFFDNIGMPVVQGWGMTEACPPTCNSVDHNKLGTSGYVFEGNEIKTSPNGELLTRGNLVMKGYYKNPEATAAVIDKEGWLHTGDKATIDSEGFVTILGRIKELFKTSTGEYVAPVPIEQALTSHLLIDMAMVVAEGRKFVSALLFPNIEQLKILKKQYGQKDLSDEEFLNSWAIRKEMEKHLNEVNKHLNHWEQVHDYRFILEPLTISGGELTPSMKIRREAVAKKYAKVIEEIYHHMEM